MISIVRRLQPIGKFKTRAKTYKKGFWRGTSTMNNTLTVFLVLVPLQKPWIISAMFLSSVIIKKKIYGMLIKNPDTCEQEQQSSMRRRWEQLALPATGGNHRKAGCEIHVMGDLVWSPVYTCDFWCDFEYKTRLALPYTNAFFAKHRVDWKESYHVLVYTTPVNSAFRVIWLVPLSRDIKYYSPPGDLRRKKWRANPILS